MGIFWVIRHDLHFLAGERDDTRGAPRSAGHARSCHHNNPTIGDPTVMRRATAPRAIAPTLSLGDSFEPSGSRCGLLSAIKPALILALIVTPSWGEVALGVLRLAVNDLGRTLLGAVDRAIGASRVLNAAGNSHRDRHLLDGGRPIQPGGIPVELVVAA